MKNTLKSNTSKKSLNKHSHLLHKSGINNTLGNPCRLRRPL